LGSLRHRFKLALISIVSLSSSQLFAAEEITSYDGLLKKAFKQSAEYQKIQAQLDVETIDARSLLALYNWSLSGGVTRVDAERPITNPFAPNQQLTTTYNVRLEKENLSGINPFLEMRSDDSNLSFPDGRSINFQTATIEAGLRVDVMKALLLKNSLQAFSESVTRKELAELSQKSAKQAFATKISKAYYQTLRSDKAFEILKTQCSEYSRLQDISSRRFKKRLIQEKDFLTIEVLYQNCQLDKKTAENNKAMDELSLLKTAGLSLDTKLDFSKAKFPINAIASSKVDVSKNVDYLLARKLLKASEQSAASLKSDLLPELDLSYSLLSQAPGTSAGDSLGEASKFDLLTHNIGLNLRYEFGESASKLNAKRALAFQAVKKYELIELENSLDRDATTISKSILYLNSGLSKARSLVKLQERKAKLFRQDFANGRGSIRDLVEAQIAYLSSLERSLLFQYNLSGSNLDLIQIKGEQIEKFN
jgi:outer membrane protein TolC